MQRRRRCSRCIGLPECLEFGTSLVELSQASFLYANLRGLAYGLALGLLIVLLGSLVEFVSESATYTPFMKLRTLVGYTIFVYLCCLTKIVNNNIFGISVAFKILVSFRRPLINPVDAVPQSIELFTDNYFVHRLILSAITRSRSRPKSSCSMRWRT